ncbi:MAG: hypothetical protein U0793_22735 [Gemmataceae bacterium]
MNDDWVEKAKENLAAGMSLSSGLKLDRLKAQGIIDERGQPLTDVRRWDAYLAVVEVRHASSEIIACFRCLKPVFGMPGGATIDIERDSMLRYLREGKKVITATRDSRLNLWREGVELRLNASGFIRSDSSDALMDEVGSVPEVGIARNGC